MAEVFHRIYTHAPRDEFGTTGGRTVPLEERDVAGVLPGLVGEIDDLLKKTTPEGHANGWVVCRYTSNEAAYGCVIVSIPDVFADAGDRPGVLNHARFVRIGANDPLDVTALVDAANELSIQDICQLPREERLRTYLDRISSEEMVPDRLVSMDRLQDLPRDVLRDFLIACLYRIGDRHGDRFGLPPDVEEPMTTLATAWCALPVGLQARSSFGVGVAAGCPVDAVFSTSATSPEIDAKGLSECVDRYLRLMLDTSFDSRSLLGNPQITSTLKLQDAVTKAEPLTVLSEEPRPGKKEMKKSKKSEAPRSQTHEAPASAGAGSSLDRQYRAMEESLRAYIDMRIAEVESQQRTAGAPTPQPSSTRGDRNLPWGLIITVSLFALAAVLAVMLFGPEWKARRGTVGQTDTRVEDAGEQPAAIETSQGSDVSANRRALRDAISRATASGKWPDELKDLLANQPALAGGAIRAAAVGDVPEQAQEVLTRLAVQVERGNDIGSERRAALRALLLEIIAAPVAREDASGPQVKIDGTLGDLTPDLLARVRERYRVTGPANRDSYEFQSEVILRWMEAREP